jgi:hypothetical protein
MLMGLYSCGDPCNGTSCSNYPHNKTKHTIVPSSEELLYIKDKDDYVIRTFNVYTIEYKGHNYVLFNGNGYNACIVHDPDCICHKNENT